MTNLILECRPPGVLTRRVLIAALACALCCTFSACQSGDASASMSGPPQRPLPRLEAVPASSLDLSVDDAYGAIPQRRTEIEFAGSRIPKADQDYLQIAFAVIDQGVLLRVANYQSFKRGKTADPLTISRMDRLITFWQSVDPPSQLKIYHKRIEQALADQRTFFDEWRTQGSGFPYAQGTNLGSHPKVIASSAALKEAYEILMHTYSSEDPHNKRAFFDYHCALDFL